jgi:general secretion pathway protein M
MKDFTRSSAAAAMRNFWRQRNRRERRLITAAALLLAPAVLVLGVLQPVHARLAVLEREVPTLRTQLAQMQDMKARSGKRAAAVGSGEPVLAHDLTARVEAALRRGGRFQGSVSRGDRGIDVAVDRAAFDALLENLAALQQSDALFVSELRLQATGTPGLVGGRFRLLAGGAS